MSTSTKTQVSRSVSKAVYAVEQSEGAGARVRRSIGGMALRNLSPFLLLDHFSGSPGSGGFPDHPHRGQTTVTYMLRGKFAHEDFLGNRGILEPGGVQWMTAGKGILHSEMPIFDPDPTKAEVAEGMQLWIDLPKAQKFCEPSYQEKPKKDITTINPSSGVEITVISGESHGVEGFVRPVGGCWYFDYRLRKGSEPVFQEIPEGWTAFAYILKGKLSIGEDPTPHDKFHTLVLSSSDGQNGVLLSRPDSSDDNDDDETHFILVAGEPLDQPVVQYGPFVVNTQQQAREAIMDFQMGRNGFERAVGWSSEIAKGH